jgi:thiamine biosynthesis lipoprotein
MTRAGMRAARARLLAWSLVAPAALACSLPSLHTRPAAPDAVPEWRVARPVLGVDLEIAVRAPDRAVGRAAVDDAFRVAERMGGLLLADHPGSEIDILTHVPGGLWLEISPETGAALSLALQIADETGGAYDPTWTALLRVWGLRGPGPPHVPRDFEIDMILRRVDYRDIELGPDATLQARRRTRRTELDLGALARGAMLDAACRRLESLGVPAARASTLHEHAVFGGGAGRPWRIPIRARALEEGASDELVGVVELARGGLAVASRGPGVPTASGVDIHDRFDPRSGRPTRSVRYAVVAGDDAAGSAGRADALLAMGPDGPAFAQAHGLRAAVAYETGELWTSEGMRFEPGVSEGAEASRPGPTAP